MLNYSRNKETGDFQSSLSCYVCRKRKVKCGRELPRCLVCEQSFQVCDYPQRVSKPGPKIGTTRKSRKRGQDAGQEPTRQRRKSISTVSADDTELMDQINGRDLSREALDHTNELRKDTKEIQDLSFIMHPSHECCAEAPERQSPSQADLQFNDNPLEIGFGVLGLTSDVTEKL